MREKKTVILIDEYDVPIKNAYFRGFYDEMVEFVRSVFESVLKSNDYLQFAVIRGDIQMMSYYEVESRFSTMKEWYNGYLFGDTEVRIPIGLIPVPMTL